MMWVVQTAKIPMPVSFDGGHGTMYATTMPVEVCPYCGVEWIEALEAERKLEQRSAQEAGGVKGG
jgi:hypothetical protein